MKKDKLLWTPDGLATSETGNWAEEKYGLLSAYIEMFSTGMVNKWGKRVYIDLYSGPGCTQIRETHKCFRGSPLIALSVKVPFDKYIFCEEDQVKLNALMQRVAKHFSHLDVSFIQGDCNTKVLDIINAVPRHSKSETVLNFCFVDPFSLNLQFNTIKTLATKYIDFLVLLALDMDGRRNLKNYILPRSKKIELFLGLSDWRKRWQYFSQTDNNFQRFLAAEFEGQMLSLGYKKHPRGNTKHISTLDKNLPLYHLAFFSRHPKGYAFWDECLKYSSNQPSFEF